MPGSSVVLLADAVDVVEGEDGEVVGHVLG